MPIPDYQKILLPVLRLAAEGETRVPDIEGRIAQEFQLTPDEREQLLPSGKQRVLHNRIHWAKFYLGKAGLVASPRRGWFAVTEEGRRLIQSAPDRIDIDRLLQFPAFREFYKAGSPAGANGEASQGALPTLAAETTPEEQIEAAYAALQSALQADLLARILENNSVFFERIIVDLLVAMGYGGSRINAARRLGGTGDGGVDGVIDEDRLGLDRVYVQAKRYAPGSSVGRPDVQGFVGSLVGLGASKGVFVTTSTFSAQAREFVRHLSQRVILIDGKDLTELMIEHDVGVRTSRRVEFKRIDEDFFADDD